MLPEASNAANFGDLSFESFRNGLVFSGDDFDGDGVGVEDAESTIGLVGTGGGVVREMLDTGAADNPMFLFICISNSPTCYNNKSQIKSFTRSIYTIG